MAFIRISDHPIRNRHMIHHPDLVMVLDPSILRLVDVTSGLKADGILVTNSRHSADDLRKELGLTCRMGTVDANKIAVEELGLPITNTTMLGSLLKARDLVSIEAMIEPLKHRFGRIAEKNLNALNRAYRETEIS